MNEQYTINLHSERSRKAKLASTIGKRGEDILWVLVLPLTAVGSYYVWQGNGTQRIGFVALAFDALVIMIAAWHKYELAHLGLSRGPRTQLDNVLTQEVLAKLRMPLTPLKLWHAIATDWRSRFVMNHLLLHPDALDTLLPDDGEVAQSVWSRAFQLADEFGAMEIDAGILTAALVLTSPAIMALLAEAKLSEVDIKEVTGWLERALATIREPKKFFGGIGRDWTSGFTPTLERFGEPVSRYVEAGGTVPFTAHADLATSIIGSLDQGMAVALVGPVGVGKTTLIDVVAEQLLSGVNKHLRYYQVVKLNASSIVAAGGNHLEPLILRLFNEAVAAGNTILFLDDAQLFFGNGIGAFDMSQLLQPILQSRRLKIIAAFTSEEWQQLRAHSQALTSGFTSVVVREPGIADTTKIVETHANLVEGQHKLLVAYEAVREAIRLSGQYMQEDAYPGKAIGLLTQAVPYADQGLLSAKSVQTLVERTHGVRVATSEGPETDILLNLEEHIHERMINQTRAVGVVAAALRRGRAGVANPKRPVGSFLFLGPTGVGKTELARSLAAVYFGSERQMIRLDMSEYQGPDDVHRLLATGGDHERSLLLQIREQPFAVVLLDEVEKAHPNILNLLLQLLDEGQLTDAAGRPASFRSAIIIATSNAGAADIAAQVKTVGKLDGFEQPLINKLITNGQFKPELINRFDEVVLFRPLNEQELTQVAQLMLNDVNKTLATQNIRVELTPAALGFIAREGYQPEFGARPMRHIIQKTVENVVAIRILQGKAKPGSVLTLDESDLQQSSSVV